MSAQRIGLVIGILALLVGEVTEDREDCAAADETDESIDQSDDESVAENWTSELVVTAEGDQRSKGDANRVEDLE